MARWIAVFAFLPLLAQEPVIRTTVPLVLVPATVTDRHGRSIEGLDATDFELYDNGVRVPHQLEVTNQPIAVIVMVQTSSISGPALAKIQKIGAMFEPLVVGARGVAALVTYSDTITVRQGFTRSADEFTASMRKPRPDGSGARLHDAVLEAVRMFQPYANYRRVLIFFGESRDRGSEAKLEQAVTAAQLANVSVYPVNYSVYTTSFTSRGDERFTGTNERVYQTGGMNLLAVFTEIARMGQKNAGDALAYYTGGEKLSFTRLAGLERAVQKAGEDLHSQYLLTFQPVGVEPGVYHRIEVRVRNWGAVVRARPGYWTE